MNHASHRIDPVLDLVFERAVDIPPALSWADQLVACMKTL